MSFSKARIQRFNEHASEVPPPGAYDPKFENKVKGLAIEKTERFQDTKSVSSTECMSVSSKGAGSTSALKFKTPPVPRKKVIVKPGAMSCPRSKTKPLICSKDLKVPYDVQNELADLKVECFNKDKTIQDQEKHIEEMKEEISAYINQFRELNEKCTADEEQYRRDIESMAKLQQAVLVSQQEKHKVELDFLRNQLVELANFKKEELLELGKREHELEEKILTLRRKETELNNRIAMLENNLSNAQGVEDLAMDLKKAEERLNELSTEMFEIIDSKDRDLENLLELKAAIEEELNDLREDFQESQQRAGELQRNLENLKESLESNVVSSKSKFTSEIVDFLEFSLNSSHITEDSASFCSENKEFEERLKNVIENFQMSKNQEIENFQMSKHQELEDLKKKFQDLEGVHQAEKLRRQEVEAIEKESSETIIFLTEEMEKIQRLYKDTSLQLQIGNAKLEAAKERQAQVEGAHKTELVTLSKFHEEEQNKLKNLMENSRLEYLQQIENMSEARNQELKDVKETTKKMIEEERKRIKEHADKLVENAEAITRETLSACRAESEERVKRVIAESDAKVNNIVRDMKKMVDEEASLVNERFSVSLKNVEAEKTILEGRLIEANSEISHLKSTLEELKNAAETQESFSQSLQAELDRAEAELAEKKEELRNFKDHIRAEAAEMVARRRRFEVVMAENQASLSALTNRLAQSDTEVKRLQQELEISEASLREHRDLLSTTQNNSKLLQEQIQSISDHLKAKENLIDQIEENCKTEIESIKSALELKIDSVIETTTKEVSRLQEDCGHKNKLNNELKLLLDEMVAKWNEVQGILLKFEEQSDEQSIVIASLQTTNIKLEMDLKNQMMLVNESKAREIENEENKQQLQEMRVKIESLEATNLHMKEEINKSEGEKRRWKMLESSLMEDLEKEKVDCEKSEREIKVLSESFDRVRSEYEDLTEKYAEVLGHHNHNQRIKHISKLKDKILSQQKDNLKLKQEVESKTNLIEQLTKTSEKAKSEEKRKLGKGKENVNCVTFGKAAASKKIRTNSTSLSKSANTTPTASPSKPLTPLRNRNE